jgi:hypothetical protein
MIFDEKYILSQNMLNLDVLELLDFKGYPILNVEIDNTGTKYLSYLDSYIDNTIEQRLIIPISDARLDFFKEGSVSLYNIFNSSENKVVYVIQYDANNNQYLRNYLIPLEEFVSINPIEQDYFIQIEVDEVVANQQELVALYATQKGKVILDFYLTSQKIKTSLPPWVFDKFLLQIQNIIGDLLDKTYKALNEKVAYSKIGIASFKVSIEITPDQNNLNLFEDVVEYKRLFKIIDLLNSESKEDLVKVIEGFKDEKFIKSYIQIVKTVIANDANIHATLANPATKETAIADFNKNKAQKIKTVIDEQLPERTDIEEVEGVFLKLDFKVNPPAFIIENDAEEIFKGKVDTSIIDTIKADKVNLTTDKYKFTIKTIHKPETTVSAEQIHRFLMLYNLIS